MKIRKGQPYIAVVYILGILMLGFTFAVLYTPMKEVFDDSYKNEHVQEDEYQQFYLRSRTAFLWLPVLLAIPMLVWFFIKANEKRNSYG